MRVSLHIDSEDRFAAPPREGCKILYFVHNGITILFISLLHERLVGVSMFGRKADGKR